MISNIIKQNTGELQELRGLFEKQLREILWAENTMLNVISGVIVQTHSGDLITLLEKHRADTLSQVNRLEKICQITGISAEGKPCEAIACLMKETEALIHITRSGVVRDAGIISLLQKMKHFEIACYGTMKAFAMALREEEAIGLLEQTLKEEKEADMALTNIAESHINTEAADKEI